MSYVRGMGRSYRISERQTARHAHPIRMVRGGDGQTYVISGQDGAGVHPISLAGYAARVRGMGQDETPAIDPNTGFEVGTFDPGFQWYTPSVPSEIGPLPGTATRSFDLGSALSQIALGGEKIAGAILQKPGQYTQTVYDPRTGTYSTVTSNAVPGAVPGSSIPYLGGSTSISSFLPIALLGLGGLALVALVGGRGK